MLLYVVTSHCRLALILSAWLVAKVRRRLLSSVPANMEKVPQRLVFVAVCTKAHTSLAQGCNSSGMGFVMSSLAVSVPDFLHVAALAQTPGN